MKPAAAHADDTHAALQRDRVQRQRLIEVQLKERGAIDQQRVHLRQQAFGLVKDMRSDRDRLIAKLTEPQISVPRRKARPKRKSEQDQGPGFDFDLV